MDTAQDRWRSTITHADIIVVMDRGRIIEQGGHEQLMRARGIYFAMVHTAA